MRLAIRLVPPALVLAVSTGVASAVLGSGVLTTKKLEYCPAAAPGWLVWTQSPATGGPGVLLARPDGGQRFKVTPKGTEGYTGSIEGSRLVYTQVRRKGDIKFFDLGSRAHSDPPSGVNTPSHESAVSFSGEWLLFRRSPGIAKGTQTIILRNLRTGEERMLATGDSGRRWAQPGTVSGNFATWLTCRGHSNCGVVRYEISSGATVPVPNPKKRAQYAASVTADGTVYFVESTNLVCGERAAIWRFTTSGQRERVARLPRGIDPGKTSPVVEGGRTTVFFDVFDCRAQRPPLPADIRKISV